VSDWRPKHAAPATFRGVPFWVDTGNQGGGRGVVAHEIPGSEDPPYAEDNGKKKRSFSVEGYVLGTEYETARDNLLTALEQRGPGELVHPYFGTRRVALDTYGMKQVRTEGGRAIFTMEFIETSAEATSPNVKTDTHADAVQSVTSARRAAQSAFTAVHSGDRFTSELNALNNVVSLASSALSKIAAAPAALAAFARIGEIAVTVGRIDALFSQLEGVAATLSDPSAFLFQFLGFVPGVRPLGSSQQKLVEQVNYDATVVYTQRAVIFSASSVLVDQVFTSYDDANAARDTLLDALDAHLEAVTDDSFADLLNLRASLVAAVPDVDLPRLREVSPPVVLPSLVLAQRIWGNVDLELDLVARNHVRHPGFVSGPLEVLGD